ncbi:TetR/AcrR family transcriptional regulator [Streptomyces luteireticuli]|uniref:ScbR family autoregulator-binding transcription factor n=1 Tax=Streptomyces luteireticuli TaxID=173858 RepID=A0ABN0Y776_9ACTN
MVKQERAARTRNSLVQAAASEFSRAGYDGTSLKTISKAAGMSMGAVTFHFASKAELAEAVVEEGRSAVLSALGEAAGRRQGKALHGLRDVTLELARLLQEEVTVRAAAHLSWHLPDTRGWASLWHPVVADLVDEAHGNDELHASARPDDVTALVVHLVRGVELTLHGTDRDAPDDAVTRLESIWRLILKGIDPADRTDAAGRSPSDAP